MSEPVHNSVDSAFFTPSASSDPDGSAPAVTALDSTKLVNQIAALGPPPGRSHTSAVLPSGASLYLGD